MIVVTKMKLGDYDVPVPVGLSELLKDAWVLKDRPEANTSAGEYTRRIEMRNGRLYTILTKKEVNANAKTTKRV
ncbi:hypothetical protein [Geobacillus stearothermophilus]|uniref:Uncharacterized protein n=1 Tax=Geobacillus stearothermophilus TaxID=1422 RepID=A0A150M9X9_GEOSE|nr:hypothetical protein [Geobacillus stearothermophilus]KYD21042.1 hypothetical protein B4109_3247 [Geobacillus stearothermophilus]